MEVKALHKGRRYCFIAVNIAEGESLVNGPDQERPAIAKAHLLHETYNVCKV